MPGQRGQLAAVGGLVQGEDDDRQARLATEPVQQGLEGAHIVGPLRDVGALVAAEGSEQRRIVVPIRARMDLHHQPVVEAHAGHLGQHLCAEQLGLGGGEHPAHDPVVQGLGIPAGEVGGGGGRAAVVGGRGAGAGEHGAALAVGGQVAVPEIDVLAGQQAEALDLGPEGLVLGVGHGVGAVGGDHPSAPAALVDRRVAGEVVVGTFGGGQDLDVEAVEQSARAEGGRLQHLADAVEIEVGGVSLQRHVEAEHFLEHMVQPDRGRRAAEQAHVLGQQAPGLAGLGPDLAGAVRHAELLQRDALAEQHAVEIVVRRQQQAGRVGERRVGREPLRIGMPVRADDRQAGHIVIQTPRDRPDLGFGREKTIRIKLQRPGHRPLPRYWLANVLALEVTGVICLRNPLSRVRDHPGCGFESQIDTGYLIPHIAAKATNRRAAQRRNCRRCKRT